MRLKAGFKIVRAHSLYRPRGLLVSQPRYFLKRTHESGRNHTPINVQPNRKQKLAEALAIMRAQRIIRLPNYSGHYFIDRNLLLHVFGGCCHFVSLHICTPATEGAAGSGIQKIDNSTMVKIHASSARPGKCETRAYLWFLSLY